MSILLGVIALFAILSLVVVVIQAVAIVRLAPASERLGSYLVLGWWKFGQIEQKAGAAAASHLQIYKRAAIAFILFIVLGVVVSGWVINQQPAQSSAAAAEAPLINDPRVLATQFAFLTDSRRVATMPGALMLES